jgi:hypothetical protein
MFTASDIPMPPESFDEADEVSMSWQDQLKGDSLSWLFGAKKQPNKWVTRRAWRVLKAVG